MFNFNYFKYSVFLINSVLLFSCQEPEKSDKDNHKFDKVKVSLQFIKANQQIVIKENDEMDYFQKSHQFPFIKTTAGIRYYVYKPSVIGDSIVNGDVLTINYTLSLLNGTICYSSDIDGVKQFKVGMQDVEDGLHKAVLHLKQGDKALILIPSYLAHGLLGDSKKIPPQSPILYDIEILIVKKEGQTEVDR